MKKFFLILSLILIIVGAIFTYILYTEGAFETKLESEHYKPFEMKCEAGKCSTGKCAGAK
jgi:hypothetical protein